jgi:hypothetical protein
VCSTVLARLTVRQSEIRTSAAIAYEIFKVGDLDIPRVSISEAQRRSAETFTDMCVAVEQLGDYLFDVNNDIRESDDETFGLLMNQLHVRASIVI